MASCLLSQSVELLKKANKMDSIMSPKEGCSSRSCAIGRNRRKKMQSAICKLDYWPSRCVAEVNYQR